MKLTKAFARATAVCAVMALAACKGKSKSVESEAAESVIPEETVTLQVFDQLANYSGEQTGWFAKVMLDKFNVKLNIISATGGTLQTRMESGNLGDLVIWGNDSEDYLNAIDKGMLLDWEADGLLDEYGAGIKSGMEKALEKNRAISKTGKIYGFGHGVSSSAEDLQGFFYTWDLRFDLYRQLGCPRIKDLDDLADVLEKMRDICPKDDNGQPTYGVSLFNDWDGNMVMFVKATATAYWGYDEFDFGLYDPSTQTFHDCLEEGGPYLTTLKFYNTLYQRGLLNPDSQTHKYNGMSEDYQNGTAFFNVFNWMGSGAYNNAAHLEEGKGMFPVRPEDAAPIAYGQSVYGGNRVWSIGADTEYPELCMAIYDWFCSPEGFLTTQYGPEGKEDGNWYIEGGKHYLTERGKKCHSDPKAAMEPPYTGTYNEGGFQINNITWAQDASDPLTPGETYNKASWASEKQDAKYAIDAAWREWAGADTPDEYMKSGKHVLCPGTQFSEEPQGDEIKVKWGQISECIKNGSWKAIYAESDKEYDKAVSDMRREAYDYGFDDCLEFTRGQVARRAAAENEALGK